MSMKNWMSAALGSMVMMGASLAQAAITDDPALVADQVFRAGVEYCNSAVKASRTDSKQARSDFNLYLSHFERAQSAFPALLEQNAFAGREHPRCLQIGDNLARAEALPVMEKGLTMCQETKAALQAGIGKESRYRYSQYEINRGRALRMAESVLKVGSIAVQVRICNGLSEKVAALAPNSGFNVRDPAPMTASRTSPAPQTAVPDAALAHSAGADL